MANRVDGTKSNDFDWQETIFEDTPPATACPPNGDVSAVSSNDDRPKTKFTAQQKATFASVSLAALTVWLSYSVIAVFFPSEAKARGMSQTVTGLVFSTFAIASTIGSTIWGKFLPLVGARFVFLAGTFVNGSCNILFGFIVDMPTEATFTVLCFLIRFLEGLGSSACLTASVAIVAVTFPDNVATAMSVIEMMNGLSFALGPPLGGILYNAGGFKLPFFVLGGLVLAGFGVNYFLMPVLVSEHEESGSVTRVLRIPAVWIALLAVFAGITGLTSLDPVFSLHLKELSYTVVERSLVFGILGATYALLSIVWGRIADKMKCTRVMIVVGALGSGVCFLILGPTPLLKIPSVSWIPWVAVPLGACFFSLTTIPTLLDMFISAEWYGIPYDLRLTAILSGLWNSALSIGAMTGPLIGGSLTDRFGFAYATTITAGGYIAVTIFICLFVVWEYRCGKGRRVPRKRVVAEAIFSTEEERAKLLLPEDA